MWAALTKNLPVKVSSLILAVLLWGMVAGQKVVPREISVPLVLPPLPDSLMLRLPVRDKVEVTFLASSRQLFWFRLQAPRMEPPILLMERAEPDTVWLDPNYLKLPRAFSGEVERIQPPFVMIQFVEVIEKKVPVKAVLGKEPRHPYRLDEGVGLVVEPSHVIARGPRRKVSQMPWVRTEFLDLQEATASGEQELGLEKEDPLIHFQPEKVKVRYNISLWRSE